MHCPKPAYVRLFALVLILSAAFAPVWAQEVRRGSTNGYGSLLRQFENAATEQGRADWPHPPDRPGTAVQLTFDPRNTDVTLVADAAFGLNRLLREAQNLAKRIGYPRAEFITLQGRRIVAVDIELNRYLRRERFRSEFDLDLSALADALTATSLPKPVVIAVDPESARRTTLRSAKGARDLESIWFTGAGEVPADARLAFSFTVGWEVFPAVFLLAPLFAIPLVVPVAMLRARRRRAEATEDAARSPEEVQSQYDKSPPIWRAMIAMPLLAVLPLFVADPDRLLATVQMLLPFPFQFVLYAMMASIVPTILIVLLPRRQAQPAGAMAAEVTDNAPQEAREPTSVDDRRYAWGLMPMLIGMLLMMVIMQVPVHTAEGQIWRRTAMYTVIGLSLASLAGVNLWLYRRGRRGLTDDPWHDLVMRTAARTGVRVRRVVVIESSEMNAYASVLGTVGLTKALLDRMEPEEVGCIVAHEIGHLKARHPLRTLVLTLVSAAAVYGLWFAGRQQLAERLPEHLRALLSSPLPYILVLNPLLMVLVGPYRRKREREADAYAVAWTCEPELVIRALTKLHTLSGTPHRLKPSDEAMAAHPSLVHRIEAIRKSSASLVSPPEERSSERRMP